MNRDTRADYELVRLHWRRHLPALVQKMKARFEANPKKVLAQWVRATSSGDPAGITIIGSVLRDAGHMDQTVQLRMAGAAVATGFGQEALELLKPPVGSNAQDPYYWDLRARAAIQAGAFDAADAAVRKALAVAAPSAPLQRFAGSLGRMRAAAASNDEAPSFSAARALAEALLGFAARRQAMRVVRDLVAAPPEVRDESLTDALAVARIAISLLGPTKAKPLVEAITAACPENPHALALQVDYEAAAGLPPATRRKHPALSQASDRVIRSAMASSYWAEGERETAISIMGPVCQEHEKDHPAMVTLAYYVGQQRLAETGFHFGPPAPKRRVFNVIMFSNEFALTRLRMEEMAEWVDYFVFAEVGQTFTGGPKPLRFDDFRHEIRAFDDKIIHVKLERFPDYLTAAWAREFYQRDTPLQGLSGLCSPNDIVIINDADEIVRRHVVSDFGGGLAGLRMPVHRFFFNYAPLPGNRRTSHPAGAITTAESVGRFGCSYLRMGMPPHGRHWHYIRKAGWHFTSINDAANIAAKMRGYSHQSRRLAPYREETSVQTMLDQIREGEYEEGWAPIEVDERLPRYIRDNREALAPFLLEVDRAAVDAGASR